jgi:stage II sporulation protein AA (anti-sigma F factor antagonist)
MTAKFSIRDGVLHVAMSGELDHHSIKPIRDETDIALMKHTPNALVVDLKNVTFMDSSGIGYIMGRSKLVKNISIVNANSSVKKVMVLSGINRIANIV